MAHVTFNVVSIALQVADNEGVCEQFCSRWAFIRVLLQQFRHQCLDVS